MDKYLQTIFISDLNEIRKNKEFSVIILNEIEQKITEKIEKIDETKNYTELLILINKIEIEHKISLKRMKEYSVVMSSNSIAETNREELIEDEENIITVLLGKLQFDKKQIVSIASNVSYETCKKLMTKIIEKKFEEGQRIEDVNNFVYPFIISENYEGKGLIICKKNAHPELITLMSLKVKKEAILSKFLGENMDFGNNFYAEYFYSYVFESNNLTYTLFSKTELKVGMVNVKGMEIMVSDTTRTGSKAFISKKASIIIATEILPELTTISNEAEFWKVINENNINTESLPKTLLGNLRHPEKFEKLLFAWLFSYPVSGYPLQLLWLAEPGTGKSYTLRAIVKKAFKEEVAAADVSTLKYLIPSYGQLNFEPGYMLRRQRVGGIDELFKKLNKQNESDTGWFVNILEHGEIEVGSGKHCGTIVKPTARFIITSNPQYKLANILEMQEKLDNAFLSRLLIYKQSKIHIDYIRSNEHKIRMMKEDEIYPKGDNWLLKIMDYLTTIRLGYDDYNELEEEINRIKEKYKSFLPYEVAETLYEPRIKHHLSCIIDGIAKYNSIIERREKLCITEKDIGDAESIIGMCVLSIATNPDNINQKELNVADKLEFLTLPQLKVYDAVKKLGSATVLEIETTSKECAKNHLDFLEKIDLINSHNNGNGISYSIKTIYDTLIISNEKKT